MPKGRIWISKSEKKKGEKERHGHVYNDIWECLLTKRIPDPSR